MPITKISIENFKGIGDRIEIPVRPITVLFGANSAGKSTILQALLYLRELLERENSDADRMMASGEAVDLGGFRQFVHGHDLERKVRIGVEISVDADGLPTYSQHFFDDRDWTIEQGTIRGCETASVEIEVSWDPRKARPRVTAYRVGVNGREIGVIESEPGSLAYLTKFDTNHPVFQPEDADVEELEEDDGVSLSSELEFALREYDSEPDSDNGKRKVPFGSRVVPAWGAPLHIDVSVDSVYQSAPSIAPFVLSQVILGSGELVLRQLREIRHIGSFRDIPERRFNSLRSHTEGRWANGAAAWDLLFANDLEWFDEDAFESLGLGYQLKRQAFYEIPSDGAIGSFLIRSQLEPEIYLTELESLPIKREIQALEERSQLRMIHTNSGVEVDPSDVGVGVSQVIPVVVGAMAPGYSVLSVEQPELHIHPAVQCSLADVLAHEVIDSSDRFLLLETHSEHLMLRWLRRIREGFEGELPPGAPSVKPEHLSVLYIESGEAGQKVSVLPVTEDGDFARKWPRGFFEERAEELFG